MGKAINDERIEKFAQAGGHLGESRKTCGQRRDWEQEGVARSRGPCKNPELGSSNGKTYRGCLGAQSGGDEGPHKGMFFNIIQFPNIVFHFCL